MLPMSRTLQEAEKLLYTMTRAEKAQVLQWVARDLGDGRMANVVMMGALSPLTSIPEVSWQKALQVRLPARYLEGNLLAFVAGQKMCENLPEV